MKLDPLQYSKYIIKKTAPVRSFVTKLNKNGAILPVILLEATVTGGRTYQAYKRDGFVEARERVTEESLGAVFWLFGATLAAKVFDMLGNMFLKVPSDMPDVGRDKLRTPFKNFINRVAGLMKFDTSKAEALEKNLARFSVGKTAASLVTACLFIGYVVPKMNQAITKHIFGRMKQKDPDHTKAPDPYTNKLTLKDARSIFSAKGLSINAVENFKASRNDTTAVNKQETVVDNKPAGQAGASRPSFKASADSLLRIVQNFQTNDVWKLLGTDVGTVTGRTANARNNDERVEIMFRDISSIYFYCFSMPAIVAFMNKKDTFKGLNTKLNPMSAMEVHNHMVKRMANKGLEKMSAADFEKEMLGRKLEQSEQDFLKKAFPNTKPATTKKVFFGMFNKEVPAVHDAITLADFEKLVDANFADKAKAGIIKQKAREMSQLNPLKQGTAMITDMQAEDLFRGGVLRKPKFMLRVMNHSFEDFIVKPENYTNTGKPLKNGVKKLTNPLNNPYKFISMNEIAKIREEITGYAQAIVKQAQKSGKDVDFDMMLRMNKRNLRNSGIFMGLAMGVSSLFLSTIIPKIQYYITYLRTGKNSFPGTENMSSGK